MDGNSGTAGSIGTIQLDSLKRKISISTLLHLVTTAFLCHIDTQTDLEKDNSGTEGNSNRQATINYHGSKHSKANKGSFHRLYAKYQGTIILISQILDLYRNSEYLFNIFTIFSHKINFTKLYNNVFPPEKTPANAAADSLAQADNGQGLREYIYTCLLYTSDAADE